jgi:glutamate-1-semialdehyde aminotransferase
MIVLSDSDIAALGKYIHLLDKAADLRKYTDKSEIAYELTKILAMDGVFTSRDTVNFVSECAACDTEVEFSRLHSSLTRAIRVKMDAELDCIIEQHKLQSYRDNR